MFLDDELFEHCASYDAAMLTEKGSITKLYQELGQKCENYYQTRLKPDFTKAEIRAIIDRTFNLWDSFALKLLKSEDKEMNILGKLFQTYTFKKAFLENKEVAEVYYSLKK